MSNISVINLDNIQKLRNVKRADYILVVEDIVVIVEETTRVKSSDLEQVENTVKMLCSGELSDIVQINPRKVKRIIHFRKRCDTMIIRRIMNLQRKFAQSYNAALLNPIKCKKLSEIIARITK